MCRMGDYNTNISGTVLSLVGNYNTNMSWTVVMEAVVLISD